MHLPKLVILYLKGLALGISSDIRYYNYNKNTTVGSSISVGPLARYYFNIKKNAIILELAYNYGQTSDSSNIVFTYPTPMTFIVASRNQFNQYSIGAGYTYFIKENVSIEALYQFQIVRESYSDNYSYYIHPPNSQKTNSSITAGLLFYF